MYKTVLGLERLLEGRSGVAQGARVGIICNQASVNHELQHAADLCKNNPRFNLTALFGPQHGIRGDVQDNMVETAHSRDPGTGVPVFSLYSEVREPTEEMLENVDVLVFDMQDVGCRIYTFIYTLANCMRAASRLGKKIVICDRPNPIAGLAVQGIVLDSEFQSFVGQFPIPTRHGMTICELGLLFNDHFKIGCELEVIPMTGWSRDQWFDQTVAPWVMPSPNMPTLNTATVFSGTVHVEGTMMSEGRGTTRPFELVGAPYIDPVAYAGTLAEYALGGVHFRPCGFQPTFQKHSGITCGGVQIHVTDRHLFDPFLTGVVMVKAAYDLYESSFAWKEPPYEYVYDKKPFDVIAGTDKVRLAIERHDHIDSVMESFYPALEAFKGVRDNYLLY